MKKIVNVFAWILSLILLLFAFVCIQWSIVSFVLFLACVILSNPLFYKIAKIKKWIGISIIPIFFIAACVTFPSFNVQNEQNNVLNDESTIEETVIDNVAESDLLETAELLEKSEVSSETEKNIKESEEAKESENTVESKSPDSLMEVHFIDVGQGDCILITCDGESMLIDAGNNDKGTTVQFYLKRHGVDNLKYVIGTHPDSDHIGGMDVILYKFDCETIIMSDRGGDSDTYRDVIDTINYKNYDITFPVIGMEYSLGNASFEIIGPNGYYDDDNNCSISIRVSHGKNSFIFTGDAEEKAEKDLIDSGFIIESSVLKLGHHGSKSSSSEVFLQAVNPQYVVICCGKDNSYGHPHSEVLDLLLEQGRLVYRTDEQGSIVATSDGNSITWNCKPSESWQAGDRSKTQNDENKTITDESTEFSPDVTYILNTNTKRFHYTNCNSVNEMKEKNKKESTQTRDELISQGYKPCGSCNP